MSDPRWEQLLREIRGVAAPTNPHEVLARSRALWNRNRLDLDSDEILAQIIDRGDLSDWRALFALMEGASDPASALRQRVRRIVFTVPTGYPWFWVAALESLGERIADGLTPAIDPGIADI